MRLGCKRAGIPFWSILCTLLFLCFPSHAQQERPLIFATLHYPPYSIVGPSGSIAGFDTDVIRVVFSRLGYRVKFKAYPWNRALQTTLNATTTGVFSCSQRNEYLMSDVLSVTTHAFYVKLDFNFDIYSIKRPADLLKYPQLSIGGVAGYSQLQDLEKLGLKYDPSPDDETIFKKLSTKRIDILLNTKEFGDYYLRRTQQRGKYISIPLKKEAFFLCFSKKWPGIKQIRKRFNAELARMKADGTYDAIHERYK